MLELQPSKAVVSVYTAATDAKFLNVSSSQLRSSEHDGSPSCTEDTGCHKAHAVQPLHAADVMTNASIASSCRNAEFAQYTDTWKLANRISIWSCTHANVDARHEAEKT